MADELIDEDTDAEEVERDQYVVFTVKSQEFGFRAMQVREISRVLSTTEVPNAPPYIEGILNLRGQLASVINFRKKFGFKPKGQDEDTRIIIVEHGDFPIGVMVDAVEEVIKIPDELVQKLPESPVTTVAKEVITGVGMLENRLIILLDVDKVLTRTELIELGKIKGLVEEAQKTQVEVNNTIAVQQQPTAKPTANKKRGKKDDKKED